MQVLCLSFDVMQIILRIPSCRCSFYPAEDYVENPFVRSARFGLCNRTPTAGQDIGQVPI